MAPPRNATVSLCMIVRNEGHQLDECLAPIANLFDDIVVVDTGSQDNSREAARRYTRRVFDFAWCDDFSAARNESLKHARGDWIFWLDADDRISQPNLNKLCGLLETLSDTPRAFLMETVLHLDDQGRDRQRITSHLRLFRRDARLQWRRRVHEVLAPWPTALGHATVFTDIQIEHLGYHDTCLAQRKLRRNLRLLRMEFAVTPEDPSVLMDLANAYAQLGKSSESRQFLREVLLRADKLPPLLQRAYTTLAELENMEGHFEASAKLLEKSLHRFPDDDYLLYMHAEALYNLGHHGQAKAALIRILHSPPENDRLRVGVPGDLRLRLVRLALGEVLRVEPALAQAEEVLRSVANDFPDDAAAWFFLGRVYIDGRQWAKLPQIAARLNACANGRVFASLLFALTQFAREDWRAAEDSLEALISQAPCMTMLRVLRAECLHRRRAPQAMQIQVCRDVLRLQPGNRRAQQIMALLETTQVASYWKQPASVCTSVLVGMGVADAAEAGERFERSNHQ